MTPAEAAVSLEGRLTTAQDAAAACGVTRLADITGLDRIGVPVFHAIRPLSRALAVHQGKALTATGAKLGALMEAIESDHAERFEGTACVAAWRDLGRAERPPSLADFGVDRAVVVGEDEPIAWTAAEGLVDGRRLYVPFDSVCMDCTCSWDRRLDRTSNGLGARFDVEGARLRGLLEVLERDGWAAWRRWPRSDRALHSLERATIPFPWFVELGERLDRAGVALSLYAIPTVIGLPAVYAELHEPGAEPKASALAKGWSCALRAEDALSGAVLEALQVRLTEIAGARDDILHDRGERAAEGFPLPPGMSGLPWEALAECEDDRPATSAELAERLAEEGYPEAAAVRLSPPAQEVCVVKVFVPGLGAFQRVRRAPGATS